MRLPVNRARSLVLPLALTALLAACGGGSVKAGKLTAAPTGPAADYPVVLGEPFQVGTTTYTPDDALNYDAVGYAEVGAEGGANISAAHKTLPLPSYAEVTSLESGRTILVRVERRGPMNENLIELSLGAAAQLGLAGSARPAVRVRRVNPPEQERAMLRKGGRAPERMETPKGLLDALNRKLAKTLPEPKPTGQATQAPPPARPTAPAPTRAPTAAAQTPTAPHEAPKPANTSRQPAKGDLVVQVATFSSEARAKPVAEKLGGFVAAGSRYWRVRMGPFASRGSAEAALAKAKAAGYSDARIQRAD